MSVLSLPFRRASLFTRVAVAGLTVTTAGAALMLLASPAHADSFPTMYWGNPGVHTITVPPGAVSVTISLLGGAGTAGQLDSGISSGGAGGGGASVLATYPILTNGAVRPGDHLQVTVGAKGGGQPGGTGDGPAGAGGTGGGATYVVDLTTQSVGGVLTVAGGGGGGGGGGAQFFGVNGGAGGSASDGTPGTGLDNEGAGRGGALGASCTFLTFGEAGESAGSGSAAGGGGGAGQGICGGQSGGSGDHGSLGGGGGGGAGYSWINGTLGSVTPTTNTGDGSASLSFQVIDQEPQLVASAASLPSTATVGKAYNGTLTASGGDSYYQWSPSGGDLPPGLSLTAEGNITGTPTEAGKYLFVARVVDSEQTPQYADVVVSLTVNPPPVVTVVLPDLAVGLSHGKLVKGSVQPFRFTVRNVGTIPATSSALSITLPAGLNPQSVSGSGWTCHRSGQSYSCTHAGAIGATKSSVVTVRARVTAPVKTALTTTASVSVTPTDANPANNSVTNTASVVAR